MRKIIEQGVITLDGQMSTPQDWLPTRWEGEFEALSRDLLQSVDALLYGRLSYENHAEVWPTLESEFDEYAARMNSIPKYVASRTLTEVLSEQEERLQEVLQFSIDFIDGQKGEKK